ncbi:hypothetical protein D3C81_1543790 [compost metagenome]
MVRLQPHRQPPRQADGIAKARHHLAFARHRHQVLVAHQLADRGRDLGGDARRDARQRGTVGLVPQQPVAQVADGRGADRGKSGSIVPVDDQSRDFVRFIRHQRLIEELRQGHIGQRQARSHPLLLAGGGDAGERIAGARRAGLGQQRAQVVEDMALTADGVGICHGNAVPMPGPMPAPMWGQCGGRCP